MFSSSRIEKTTHDTDQLPSLVELVTWVQEHSPEREDQDSRVDSKAKDSKEAIKVEEDSKVDSKVVEVAIRVEEGSKELPLLLLVKVDISPFLESVSSLFLEVMCD